MISETFYEEPLKTYLSATGTNWKSQLDIIRKQAAIPDDVKSSYDAWVTTKNPPSAELVLQVTDLFKKITEASNNFSRLSVPTASFDAVQLINNYYQKLEDAENDKAVNLRKNAEAEKITRETEYQAHVAEVEAYNEQLLAPLKEKQKELLEYKDKLEDVFQRYDISPLDVTLPDDMDVKYYTEVVDTAVNACKSFGSSRPKIVDTILQQIEGDTNLTFTTSVLVILIIVTYIALPLVSIPIFCIAFLNIHRIYSYVNSLRLASALMSEVNFRRFVPADAFREVEDLQVDDIAVNLDKKLSDEVKDYTNEKNMAIERFKPKQAEVTKQLEDLQRDMGNQYNSVAATVRSNLETAKTMNDEALARVKAFPDICSNHIYMSHDYVLSKKGTCIDVTKNYPILNFVFDTSDRGAALNNMRLYLCNALLNVQVKQLTIEIFDPLSMCVDFTEFMTVDTKDYIKPNAKELRDLIKTVKQTAQSNVIDLNGMSIDDYNKDAEERELVPKAYTLVLLVSGFEELMDERHVDEFYDFLKICNEQGVMFWILDTVKHKNCEFISGSNVTEGDVITYNRDLGIRAVSTFVTTLANFKDRGISYKEKMGDKFIPYDKWWTFDTIHGIKMPYGLEKGDPTRGLNVAPEIGDANVHALLAGATGAGKSACINQLLMSLITMYPPSELELVYIDFKNVEAAKFTGGYDTKAEKWMETSEVEKCLKEGTYYDRVSRIPHLRIISGTTDGGYALSVFEFLMNEMKRRQGIINKFGHDQTKIEGVRKCILEEYINTVRGGVKCSWADMRKDWDWYKPNVYDVWGDLPRLLIIFDEFQVMYNPEYVDPRTIDTINSKITAITKLARAMGAHFWFTSQSMKGTMSKDTIANFSLRGALRCTDDVSNELLGNPAASTIKAKFGYMYTNDSAGTNKDANRLWRVPFLSESDMSPEYIDKLFPMLEKFNEKHRMARFYDEKVLVPASILADWYQTHYDAFADARAFILGERAEYSTNTAPITMSLQCDTGENVIIAASERPDLLNLLLTVLDNIGQKKDSKVNLIMNIQDKESNIIIGGADYVSDTFKPWVSPDTDVLTIMDAVRSLIDLRKTKDGPFDPIYVVGVNWERLPILKDFKHENEFISALRDGPVVGVHFILAVKNFGEMTRGIVSQCQHKILGLLTTDASRFTDSTKVEKLPTADKENGLFAFYEFGTKSDKFRIYQHEFKQEIKSREIVI